MSDNNINETIQKLVAELVQVAKLKDPDDSSLLQKLGAAREEIVNLRHVIATKQKELDNLSNIVMRQGSQLERTRPARQVYEDGFNAAHKTFSEQFRSMAAKCEEQKNSIRQLKRKLNRVKKGKKK